MRSPMDNALKHAKARAKSLSHCNVTYIIQISLKELSVSSSRDGFYFAKDAVRLLGENPRMKLRNGVYTAVGVLGNADISDEQVEKSIHAAIQEAWENRNEYIWSLYFPIGKAGMQECPSNKDFLMAIVDFVEMWKAACEEVNYGK